MKEKDECSYEKKKIKGKWMVLEIEKRDSGYRDDEGLLCVKARRKRRG